MGELAIRRERSVSGPRYRAAERTEKAAAGAKSQPPARTAGATVSETLQRLMTHIGRAEASTRESHRTLQVGEAVLDEVQSALGRMAELAEKAASAGADTRALQAELERLRGEIDRMTGGARSGGDRLFLDGDMEIEEGAEPPADAGEEEAVQPLPDWLLKGLGQNGIRPERLLSMLGLDKTAGIADILNALSEKSLANDAAGYLAALYLGAVISGGSALKTADLQASLEGLRQFMEKIAEGVSPDRAVELLTDGAFASLSDLEAQFTGGVAPGLQEFLEAFLLPEGDALLPGASLLALLAGMEGMELDLMLGLLSAVQSSAPEAGADLLEAGGEAPYPEASRTAVLELPEGRVTGRDLSGVSLDEATGELTAGGGADIAVQGTEARSVLLTGGGTAALRLPRVPVLTAAAPDARVSVSGEVSLEEVRLLPGASLTLGGGGLARIGSLRAEGEGVLRLTGGAVIVAPVREGESFGALPVPVVVDGPVLLAARAAQVTSAAGKPMAPFDIVWRTLLPGWSAITALAAEGRQGRAALMSGEPARLWLEKGNPSQGSPIQPVVIRGKDRNGQPAVRYAYLRWNESAGVFEEAVMYPNPFTVSGGEEGTDWVYEEETHTLRILTNRVSSVSGGAGLDANQAPFSGRLALADGIGPVELILDGVVCRVSEGGAFTLGRENEVSLLLRSGTSNLFESGGGWAGISLGEDTTLSIDCPDARESARNPAGTLTASGGAGGAGIGRDSGGGRDRTGRVVIRGGGVTASGSGGGAGIGAGKRSAMGPIDILGGTVSATGGSGGGAGIGGALGGPVGDIRIRGGSVTAQAVGHAAAIGAGVQGACGDILISGAARIQRALGGDPGADIGACLFGGCGKVQITGGADIGRARLWVRSGIPLQIGAETVTLPQFRLSSRALGLDRLSLTKKEAAQAAQAAIERDRRWVSQIQSAYHVLYHRLERSYGGLLGARQYLNGAEGPVRDTGEAGALLADTRRSIPLPSSQAMRTHGKRGTEDVRQLLR
ncbi:hypothetical protein [uncultured Oscillibacter sp.]|uniref:flagellin N-terminal helical domain-containing protein n=1 Tax=uncultured Oscillibacter sp. TaxID=876091 RepID=UPI0026370955|nr:hypothetical protein [uncultured Oscillibacter sp.]